MLHNLKLHFKHHLDTVDVYDDDSHNSNDDDSCNENSDSEGDTKLRG